MSVNNVFARRLILPVLALALCAFSEEKNGLLVTVTKATLERSDQRGSFTNTDRIDRTQGLKAVIKNVSFKPMPEGEVNWELLIRKYNSSEIESYTGTEKLKALRTAESVELTIGSAPILGYRYGTEMTMDKIEWRIIVKREGAEVFRASSISAFDGLAKRATPVTPARKGK